MLGHARSFYKDDPGVENMKPLAFTALALVSTPGLAAPAITAQYGDLIGAGAMMLIGTITLILARRRTSA